MGIVDLPLDALVSYQSPPCVIGVTADRSYREASQAPGTTSSVVDVHLYEIIVVAPGPRHHPTWTFL
jgi:hypothetical protein